MTAVPVSPPPSEPTPRPMSMGLPVAPRSPATFRQKLTIELSISDVAQVTPSYLVGFGQWLLCSRDSVPSSGTTG